MELPKNVKIQPVKSHLEHKKIKGEDLSKKTKNLPKNITSQGKLPKSKTKK